MNCRRCFSVNVRGDAGETACSCNEANPASRVSSTRRSRGGRVIQRCLTPHPRGVPLISKFLFVSQDEPTLTKTPKKRPPRSRQVVSSTDETGASIGEGQHHVASQTQMPYTAPQTFQSMMLFSSIEQSERGCNTGKGSLIYS